MHRPCDCGENRFDCINNDEIRPRGIFDLNLEANGLFIHLHYYFLFFCILHVTK